MFRLRSILVFAALLLPCAVRAQIAEGILMATQPLPSSSRGLAMSGNLISAADGIDALDYNPAALAPIALREFTIGLFNREHNSTANFFSNSSNASLDATSLSSLGIAAPFPTAQGHFAIGVSFDRVRDYTSSYSFSAVNPNSSYFNTKGFLTGFGSMPLSGTGYYDYNNQGNNRTVLQ